MSNSFNHSILIVEPNEKLTHPYNLLPSNYHITRVSTIAEARATLTQTVPSITLLSASFSPEESVSFLEKLHQAVSTTLPKLIFVVDFSNPINTIPGTSWGETAQVITTTSPNWLVDRLVA